MTLQQLAEKENLGSIEFADYTQYTYEELQTIEAEESSMSEGGPQAVPDPNPTVLPSIYYFHPDHLGTSTFLTDFQGKAYQFFLNLPFGETMAEQLPSTVYKTPYKFNGKELDAETGLYYYGARYYDPKISLWLGVDPLAEKYPNISPYAYVANNPINAIDPDGKKIVFAKGVSKEFRKAFALAIKHLNKNKAGGIFAKLEARKEIFTIQEGNANDKYSPSTKTITWDSNNGLLTNDGVLLSPTTALNHEGDHALQNVENPEQYSSDRKTPDPKYDNLEEKRVIEGSEQRTAKALGEIKEGEVTRTDHGGQYLPTIDPTSTTGKNEVKIVFPKKLKN